MRVARLDAAHAAALGEVYALGFGVGVGLEALTPRGKVRGRDPCVPFAEIAIERMW